jgi:DNA-binding IclR family transcriptional regulator
MSDNIEKKVAKEGSEWVVRATSTGRVLGRHKTKREAERQLRAIEANKHTPKGN